MLGVDRAPPQGCAGCIRPVVLNVAQDAANAMAAIVEN
jgi:hypothetical protein